MKNRRILRLALAAAALTALLAGCTINIYHSGPMHRAKADPAKPQVTVVDGKIQVQPDPIVFAKEQVNVAITWHLPPDGKLSFPENGIVFERAATGEIVDCHRGEKLTTFICLNRHSKPGTYKYEVRVQQDGKPLDPLDPHVVND
jgi:hypothetical protein